jgi:hypothetical protein
MVVDGVPETGWGKLGGEGCGDGDGAEGDSCTNQPDDRVSQHVSRRNAQPFSLANAGNGFECGDFDITSRGY